jgi:hypothetical protein
MLSSTKEQAAFFDERALLNPLGIFSPKSLLRNYVELLHPQSWSCSRWNPELLQSILSQKVASRIGIIPIIRLDQVAAWLIRLYWETERQVINLEGSYVVRRQKAWNDMFLVGFLYYVIVKCSLVWVSFIVDAKANLPHFPFSS